MPEPPPALPATLQKLATRSPQEPWIFHRPTLDWRWLSYGQVADQVARGAEALGPDPGKVACPEIVTPAAVAAALAIQAAGGVAAPHGKGGFEPPEVRRRIDRWTPQPIPDTAAEAAFATADGTVTTHAELHRAAEDWTRRLPAGGPRPLVAASPRLEAARRHELLAYSLTSGAALILEDLADAFVAAVLWCRPTVVAATGPEIAELAKALEQKKHRRWHRLRAVVADADPEGPWDELGVAVVRFAGP